MTYKELKEKAQNKLNKAENLLDLKASLKFYDIDEKLNLIYLNKLYEINKGQAFKEFISKKYTLKYDDRLVFTQLFENEIINEQKKYGNEFVLCQNDKLENVFLNLLKYISKEKNLQLSDLYSQFCNKYYIDTPEFNIPFIYGNDELIFSYAINSFYNFFIINREYPIFKLENTGIIDINSAKIIKRKSSMLKKKIQKNEIKEEYEENKERVENLTNPDLNFTEKDQSLFKTKKIYMKSIIGKYISDEFQKTFKYMSESISDEKLKKKYKYCFVGFFELCEFLILKLDKSIESNEFTQIEEFYYENIETKLQNLKKIKNNLGINFYYLNNTKIDLDKFNIENKDYYIEIDNKKYSINFHNYVIKALYKDMGNIIKNKYEFSLNNIKNYSLQGCILNNRCFGDKNLFDSFIEDINDNLGKSTLEEAFNSIIPFKNYNYPFSHKKFREQLNEIVFYLPFIYNNNILGTTLRNLGIIMINANIFNFEKYNNIHREYSRMLMKSCFGKITFFHESNFHYLLKVCSSQDEELTCKTPYKYYKNYTFKKAEVKNSENYDGGDFGEALIFGEKIYDIYLPGAEQILSKNFWNKKNVDFTKLGKSFILTNNKKHNYDTDFTIISDFTKKLYDISLNTIQHLFLEIDYSKPKDLGNSFVRMRNTDKSINYKIQNIGELSVRFVRNIPDVIE